MLQPNRARISKTPAKVTGLPTHFPPQRDDDEISLIELAQILIKQKYVILGTTLASLLVATVYCFSATDIYRAETTLAPTLVSENKSYSLLQQLGGAPNIAAMANLGQDISPNQTAMALAILHSRTFTDSFIQDQGLLDILTTNKDGTLPKQQTEAEKRWAAYSRFNATRKTSIDRNNGIITLSIDWNDPRLAAEWTNSLVKHINKHLQTRAIQDAEKSIIYLNEQLKKTSIVELHSVLNSLIEGQVKKITLASINDQYAFKVIDPAIPPQDSIFPQRRLVIMLSLIGGVVLGVFLAFVINFINKIRNSAQQETNG